MAALKEIPRFSVINHKHIVHEVECNATLSIKYQQNASFSQQSFLKLIVPCASPQLKPENKCLRLIARSLRENQFTTIRVFITAPYSHLAHSPPSSNHIAVEKPERNYKKSGPYGRGYDIRAVTERFLLRNSTHICG